MLKKMGKKAQRASKTRIEEEEQQMIDAELEAEMAAIAAMKAEKAAKDNNGEKSTYNKEGLIKAYNNLDTTVLPFLENMIVSDFELKVENELDDIEREMSFYNHALAAVAEGRSRMKELGMPIYRPEDYFCEQIKSDAHMARIKDRLILEEKKIEAFEQRKNREQTRKFAKQVAQLKKSRKSEEKQSTLKEIQKIKTNSSLSSDEKERKLNDILNSGPKDKSKKRQIMDKKYGHGGKDAKLRKKNDAKSFNDTRDFNPRGGKFVRREKKGSKGSKRPGKENRSKAKAARKNKH